MAGKNQGEYQQAKKDLLRGKSVAVWLGTESEFFEDILISKGFSTAIQMLSVFLMLGTDESNFKIWLKGTCGATASLQDECTSRLAEWCKNNDFCSY